ncbi:MAG: hypothetical protein ACOCUQ_02375 [Bacteroidota bacterium]
MEDFFYIILAIFWLVISLLGGRKKKQQSAPTNSDQQTAPTVSQEQTQEPVELEDMLEDFFQGESKKKKEKQVQGETFQNYEDQYQGDENMMGTDVKNIAGSSEEIKKFEGEIGSDFEFASEGKIETIEDRIKSYDQDIHNINKEDEKIEVEELDEELNYGDIDFDGRKAIIYSEIINKKYF